MTARRLLFNLLSFFFILFIMSPAFGQEEEKKLEWSGNLDSKYIMLQTRPSSPFYQLNFYGAGNLSDYLSQYKNDLYLNADYQAKDAGFHLRTLSTYYDDSSATFSLLEAYGSLNLSQNSFIQAGKRAYNWGKGYAFNPVGYVNPQKDPENPEQARPGIESMGIEYVKSIDSGPLANYSFTGILIPAIETINSRYAQLEDSDIALKTYFLLLDTDLDIMTYLSRANAKQVGFDFSKNIKENFEIHGEWSSYWNDPKYVINNNSLNEQLNGGNSWLLGLRYLSQQETTVIAEYYHNGNGQTRNEYSAYQSFVSSVLAGGSVEAIRQAQSYSQNYFGGSTLMQDYLYCKISQPEPFNWLYFTPSLFTIYNLTDGSYLLSSPLSFKTFTNFELILWPTIMVGADGTEFGGKQIQKRFELWMRYYF